MKIYKIKSSIIKNNYEEREIKFAFHDIDGTHSFIRVWQPVMSTVLNDVIKNGLKDNFDSDDNVRRLTEICGKYNNNETDSFCIESAGLSGLTQMEWSIRRAIEDGKIDVSCDKKLNAFKIKEIWKGIEVFEQEDSIELKEYLANNCGKLFRLYEKVLNSYCRDKNLVEAKRNPEKYRISGSIEFLKYLKDQGVKNYFVTGAVVEPGKGMAEEVAALGFEIGENKIVEALIGSSWDEKQPKNIIMQRLLKQLNGKGEEVLVVGDGRSEITAATKMGAFTIGRLEANATRQRAILEELGVNIIIENYINKDLYEIIK